jgi:predicted secreted protein
MAGNSTAISAQGSQMFVDTSMSGSAQWTQIKGLKSYSGFDGKATVIDVTDLDSEAKEKRPGLMDNGTFSMDVNRNLTDPGQAALLAMQKSQEIKTFKLVYPVDSDLNPDTFSAFVTSFPIAGGVDGVMTSTIALEITGPVTPLVAG